MKFKIIIFLNITIPLIFGLLFYLMFRNNIIILSYFNRIYKIEFNSIRTIANNVYLPNFLKYSLTDAFWMYSLSFLLFYIWRDNNCLQKKITIFNILIAITFEILQLIHIISGTFDLIDILMMVIAIAISKYMFNNIMKGRII